MRTKEQMFPMIEEMIKSKRTTGEFAKSKGISKDVMGYWKSRYKKWHQTKPITPSQSEHGFVKLPSNHNRKEQAISLKIGDIHIEIPKADHGQLVAIIKAIKDAS